jgi:alpha-mannosidase
MLAGSFVISSYVFKGPTFKVGLFFVMTGYTMTILQSPPYPHIRLTYPGASFTLAYQNQTPTVTFQLPLQRGVLPAEHAFAAGEAEGLALTAVKISEDNDDAVFRWFNMTGQKASMDFHAGSGSGTVYRSGVPEERGEVKALDVEGKLFLKPAEIVTLCLTIEQ